MTCSLSSPPRGISTHAHKLALFSRSVIWQVGITGLRELEIRSPDLSGHAEVKEEDTGHLYIAGRELSYTGRSSFTIYLLDPPPPRAL